LKAASTQANSEVTGVTPNQLNSMRRNNYSNMAFHRTTTSC